MYSMIFIIVGLLTSVVYIVGARIYQHSKVSSGEKISEFLKEKSALMVIDVQQDTLNIKKYGDGSQLMNNINAAINYARDKNIEILYTKQEFSNPMDKLLSGGLFKKDSSGVELRNDLNVLSSNIFSKDKLDSFTNKDLENFLLNKKITKLYIVDADASACVYKTALAGSNRNYKVVVLKDSIFSLTNERFKKAISNYGKNGIETITLNQFLNREP